MIKQVSRLFIIAVLFSVVAPFVFSSKIDALSGIDFNASRIIDDTVFFNSSTQNIDDVQRFLNAKVPSCDTWGAKPSGRSGYPTRADWGRANNVPPPYTCLRDYSQSHGTVTANAYCGNIAGGTKSAAQIIYDVSRACNVNTQVLLVLLQKEQSLITDDWPWPKQYRSATGFGCPDTAPCDVEYYGYFNQVYTAAKQFKRYVQEPGRYNYASGRMSFVSYQANAPSCGGSNLMLQNGATAALYNYTPYQPNQAALNNLYGSGDACSAYGNRNFWRLFNDWFGPTLGDLVRTVDNATVYLVSGDYKYPIADMSVLDDYSVLGPIRFVTNEYAGQKTTGPTLGHMVGASNGTLYFVNSGIKLPFNSCEMVEDYGLSCSNIIYLSDGQLSRLYSGPFMTQQYATTSGKTFHVDNGKKREVYDQQALTAAGISGSANMLLESGIGYLPYGDPVIRDRVVVLSRNTGQYYFYENSKFYALNRDIVYLPAFSQNITHRFMDDPSVLASQRTSGFNGLVKSTTGNKYYVLLPSGKAELTTPTLWAATGAYVTVSDTFINSLTADSSGNVNSRLVKPLNNGTIYYVEAGKLRPVPGWGDLESLKVQPFTINTITDTTANSMTKGGLVFGPGLMVKTPDSGTVYIVKNTNQAFPISSFAYPQELGLSPYLRVVSNSDMQQYTIQGVVQNKLLCGSTYYVGINGQAHAIAGNLLAIYGFSQNEFVDGGGICANLSVGQAVDRFIRTNNGTIYYVEDGQKKPLAGIGIYQSRGGNASNTLAVSDIFAQSIPSGPVLYN